MFNDRPAYAAREIVRVTNAFSVEAGNPVLVGEVPA